MPGGVFFGQTPQNVAAKKQAADAPEKAEPAEKPNPGWKYLKADGSPRLNTDVDLNAPGKAIREAHQKLYGKGAVMMEPLGIRNDNLVTKEWALSPDFGQALAGEYGYRGPINPKSVDEQAMLMRPRAEGYGKDINLPVEKKPIKK